MTPLAAAALHVGAPERILQIECGDGDGALFLAREFPSARVRGVDRSADAVHAATTRVGLDPEGRVAFKQGTPRALPFPDDHFDLVAALDAKLAPREVARVLRPGGFLIVASSKFRGGPQGPVGRMLRCRLARCRLHPVMAEAVGDGSFAVACLRPPGSTAPSQ
jgi:ubiquinone/menaquinone biosynthesis C-methylase UbiE